jgi:hypothetical protein
VQIAVDGMVEIDGGGKPAAVLQSCRGSASETEGCPGGVLRVLSASAFCLSWYAYTEVATSHAPGWTTAARSVPLAVS